MLYARQLAWLRSTPEKQEKSRIEQYLQHQIEPYLPDLDEAQYLANYLEEIGACHSNGMGLEPLRWTDIKAWCELSGTDLDYWECQLIRDMSYAYTAELSHATDPKRLAPCVESHAGDVDARLKMALRSLKNFKKQKE